MNIYTTIDCMKLTEFENLLLATIKGCCYDFDHALKGNPLYKDAYANIVITVSKLDDKLAKFEVRNSAVGLLSEVKSLIEPFSHNFKIQGDFNAETKTTRIILQRFVLRREHLTYFQAQGISN